MLSTDSTKRVYYNRPLTYCLLLVMENLVSTEYIGHNSLKRMDEFHKFINVTSFVCSYILI